MLGQSFGFSAVEALVMLSVLFLFGMILMALRVRFQRDPASMNFPFQTTAETADGDGATALKGGSSIAGKAE